MKFETAQDVLKCIRAGDNAEFIRSNNRVKVTNAANFMPPLDDDTAEKLQIKTNVNWGELAVTLSHARMQLLSAFLGNQFFLTVKIPLAPSEYQAEWEAKITTEINKAMRNNPAYFELHRNRWNSVVLHGIGPMTWRHSDKWLPRFVALDDLRIPTDTTLDFTNLTWYAQRISYTPIELVEEVWNKKKNNHWDKKAVAEILENYKELSVTDAQNNWTWSNYPEKMADLIKQNGGFYGSDAVPTIPLYHFYYQEEDKNGDVKWYMKVVPDTGAVKGGYAGDEFLWESDDPIADDWRHLIHCQFGDLSADTPYKFHSVRGLGFALLEPTFFSNLLRCRLLDHINDNLNVWFQSDDPANKARPAMQQFGNNCMLVKGLRVVPAQERHQADAPLLEFGLAQMKQLQGEASTSYTQQTDTGTSKEQTAFETRVKLEQVNAMMGGILLVAFTYEAYAYKEICRRFCIPDSTDEDVKRFQKRMARAGIPKDFLDVEMWDVEPVTPLGQGNPTLALATAQQLMAIKDQLSPEAQQQVLHDYILVTTKSPSKAAQLAPLDKKDPSDATQLAADRFGALMQGVPLPLRNKNLIDQIDILLPLLAGKVTQFTQRNNMADQDEGIGLVNTSTYIGQAIAQLGQDPQQKARVKQYTDGIGKLNNEIKGLIQRGQQAAEAQAKQQADAAGAAEMAQAQAKIQSQAALTQAKIDQGHVKAAQQATHKQLAFEQDQQRQDAKTKAEIDRQATKTLAETQNAHVATIADVQNKKIAAENKPEPANAK